MKGGRGFSLLEALVASAILAPAMIVVFDMVESLQRAYSRGEMRADVQQSARITLARIVRDLRGAGSDPSGVIARLPVTGPIQTAEASRIAFVGDANGDGSTEKIEYRLDTSAEGAVLRRQQWSTWSGSWSGTNGAQPLAEGITAVAFSYVGASGTVIPQSETAARLREIRRVGIVVIAVVRPNRTSADTYRLESEVRIRNVGL